MTIPDVDFIGMVLNSNLVTGTLFYFIIHTNHFNGNDISVWTPESVNLSLIGYASSSSGISCVLQEARSWVAFMFRL